MLYLIYKYAQHYNHINKGVLDNQAKLASLEKYFSSEVEWKIKIENNIKSISFEIKQTQQELKQRDKLLNHSLELINGMKLVEHLKNEKDFARKAELNQYQQPLCDDQDPGGKKILSFSLYGKMAETYGRFIKNIIEEASTLEIHRHFTIRIYVDHHFPSTTRSYYKGKFKNIQFCNANNIPKYGNLLNKIGTIWRFIPLADTTVDILCPRDLDSPLLERESDAMKEWLLGDEIIHVMRDRKVHIAEVMAGMWCFRNSKNRDLGIELFETIISDVFETDPPTIDQVALNKHVWPKVKFDSLQHDSYQCNFFPNSKPFPTKRKQFFIGCVRDCSRFKDEICPEPCRPKNHKDWIYC